MSYKNKLLIGLLVELIVAEGEYKGTYRTRIEDIGEKTFTVGAPIDHGVVVPLRKGTKVKFVFVDEAASYSFEGKILQRISVPIPMLVFELPDVVERIQRRKFFRVPALYPVSFQLVTEEGLSDPMKGTTLDISGGGMRFLTKERVEGKSLLYVILSLPIGELKTDARVCHNEKIEDNKIYVVSVEFLGIPERERDRIIYFIFESERARRQKGQE
ncbi:MAG: flagellar brake protein [Desulfosporosinus sp.]